MFLIHAMMKIILKIHSLNFQNWKVHKKKQQNSVFNILKNLMIFYYSHDVSGLYSIFRNALCWQECVAGCSVPVKIAAPSQRFAALTKMGRSQVK